MAPRLALLDSGPLYAAADSGDRHHEEALKTIAAGFRLIIPVMVVTEVTYMVGRWLGASAESRFLKCLSTIDIDTPHGQDWTRMAELVEQYADFPLGGTDASVVAAAERLQISTIVTLDRRHFGAIRPRHCPAFSILP